MKRQFLEELNIEKEAIDSIMAEYGKEIKALKDKNTELKDKYSELSEQYKDIDIEALKTWETKYNDLVAQNEKEASERAFNSLLSDSFKKFNVRDNEAVKVHLDLEKIKEATDDESKLKIMEEQLTNMQKEKDYLFNVVEEKEENTSSYNYIPGGGSDNDSSHMDIINAIKGIF